MKYAIAVLKTKKGWELISHGLPSVVIPAYRGCTKAGKAHLCDNVLWDRTKWVSEPAPVKEELSEKKGKK